MPLLHQSPAQGLARSNAISKWVSPPQRWNSGQHRDWSDSYLSYATTFRFRKSPSGISGLHFVEATLSPAFAAQPMLLLAGRRAKYSRMLGPSLIIPGLPSSSAAQIQGSMSLAWWLGKLRSGLPAPTPVVIRSPRLS